MWFLHKIDKGVVPFGKTVSLSSTDEEVQDTKLCFHLKYICGNKIIFNVFHV